MCRVKIFWVSIFACLLIFQSQETYSQSSDGSSDASVWNWLTKESNIGIRRSYSSSSKDENKPASFFYYRDYKNDLDYVTMDLAIKISEFSLFDNDLIFYPKIEWHKNSNAENKVNSLAGGVNLEYFPINFRDQSESKEDGWLLAPWFQGGFSYSNDRVKELQTLNSNLLISFKSNIPFLPGSQVRRENGSLIFRYFVYSGFEHYSNAEIKNEATTYFLNRVFMEFWPLKSRDLTKQYLQLTLEANYRVGLNDKLYQQGNNEWIVSGLNFYPLGNQNIGFGLEVSNGYDPKNSFSKTGRMTFGLNLKI